MNDANIALICENLEKQYNLKIKDTLLEKYTLYDMVLLDPRIAAGGFSTAEQLRNKIIEDIDVAKKDIYSEIAQHNLTIDEHVSQRKSKQSKLNSLWRKNVLSILSGKSIGIEKLAYRSLRKSLNSDISELSRKIGLERKEIDSLEKRFLDSVLHTKISKTYPLIDMSFLKMRDDKTIDTSYDFIVEYTERTGYHCESERKVYGGFSNLPRFSVTNYASFESTILINHTFRNPSKKIAESTAVSMPNIPADISTQELSGMNLRFGVSNYDQLDYLDSHFVLKSYFKGFIPEEVKTSMRQAKKYFGNEIYIISEADWKLEEKKIKISAAEMSDSLVIGLSPRNIPGTDKRGIYLISSFSCTPMKNYLL